MLIVKIMSGEHAADDDSRKTHTLLTDVKSCQFVRHDDGSASAVMTFGGARDGWAPERFAIEGNAYVMNENGKTISSFGITPLDPDPSVNADDQVKVMVDRFLSWTLPEDFHPDGGIRFGGGAHRPVGTNLFDCRQAEAMVRHMLDNPPRWA